MKKLLFIIMTIFGILSLLTTSIFYIVSNYEYNNEVLSYWNLADKSSTVLEKQRYIDKFVDVLENSNLQGKYNAIKLKTPDNNFDTNLNALKSLQKRLHEIETMDVTSFEYQTAMQQITAQEQGEASDMLEVFRGIWYKSNYILLWDWIMGLQTGITIIILVIGAIGWVTENDNKYY